MSLFNFLQQNFYLSGFECPICHHYQCWDFLDFKLDKFIYKLVKCDVCDSLIYSQTHQENAYSSKLNEDTFDDSIKHYILIGCGIENNISILSRIKLHDSKSFLEIGCGFGFTVHYAEKFLKLNAIGLESAKYGRIGKKALNINIIDFHLNSSSSPIGRFDVILASEVIEHVSDPSEFLKMIKHNLSDSGILILTTPGAESIMPSTNEQDCLSALYPGQHLFLLSKKSLTGLLVKNGFTDIKVFIKNEKLIAYACPENNLNKYLNEGKINNEGISYLEYLSKEKNSIVREGALYRLFREYINHGNLFNAQTTLNKLIEIIEENYSIEFSILLSKFFTGSEDRNDEISENKIPPYLGMLFYYMGILYSSKPEDIQKKLIYFQMSVNLLKDYIKRLPRLSQEAATLLPVAELHFRLALIDNIINENGVASGKAPNKAYKISKDYVDRYITHFENLRNLNT